MEMGRERERESEAERWGEGQLLERHELVGKTLGNFKVGGFGTTNHKLDTRY
jgi:hypothetical protein